MYFVKDNTLIVLNKTWEKVIHLSSLLFTHVYLPSGKDLAYFFIVIFEIA